MVMKTWIEFNVSVLDHDTDRVRAVRSVFCCQSRPHAE